MREHPFTNTDAWWIYINLLKTMARAGFASVVVSAAIGAAILIRTDDAGLMLSCGSLAGTLAFFGTLLAQAHTLRSEMMPPSMGAEQP